MEIAIVEVIMNELQMQQIVERFSQKSEPELGEIKVTQVSDFKTVYVEHIDGVGRSIVLSEYKVDGKKFWAGYSSNSSTVFISLASRTGINPSKI